MHKNAKKMMHDMHQSMIDLTVQSRGVPEVTFDDAHKDALRDLHKDAQKNACEVALQDAYEFSLESYQWLHFLVQ